MESAEKFEESLSYMDQCKVICLGYISSCGRGEKRSGAAEDLDSISTLCNIADQELSGFGDEDELQSLVNSAIHLAEERKKASRNEEKMEECIATLRSFLNEEAFNECANELAQPPIESWGKVSQILHLVYKTCVTNEHSKLGTIIDFGVRYMRKNTTEFVNNEGGWRVLGGGRRLVQKLDDSSVSSSMVVVQPDSTQVETSNKAGATGDADTQGKDVAEESKGPPAQEDDIERKDESIHKSPKNRTPVPLSPLNTPPYSFPSSVTTDDERDSLATPPELVERPQMTESYLQAMGEDDTRRISSASGNGFEIIDSDNGGPEQPRQSIDDVQAFEPHPESEGELKSTSIATGQATKETKLVSEPAQPVEEDAVLGGYLPHISLGVAAVAAVAGFFVLKKNL